DVRCHSRLVGRGPGSSRSVALELHRVGKSLGSTRRGPEVEVPARPVARGDRIAEPDRARLLADQHLDPADDGAGRQVAADPARSVWCGPDEGGPTGFPWLPPGVG